MLDARSTTIRSNTCIIVHRLPSVCLSGPRTVLSNHRLPKTAVFLAMLICERGEMDGLSAWVDSCLKSNSSQHFPAQRISLYSYLGEHHSRIQRPRPFTNCQPVLLPSFDDTDAVSPTDLISRPPDRAVLIQYGEHVTTQ